jgi:vancomycin resistance protein YoaR
MTINEIETKQVPIVPPKASSPLERIIFVLLLSLGVFFILVLVGILGFQAAYSGRIYPGITVGDIAVGGLEPDEARLILSNQLNYPVNGTIIFTDNEQSWQYTPMELGFLLDTNASIEQAFEYGRTSLVQRLKTQYETFKNGKEFAPIFVYDQRITSAVLEEIRQQTDLETIEATLKIENNEVVVTNGQNGRELNAELTIEALLPYLSTYQNVNVQLPIIEQPANILDASPQAEMAREAISQDFTINKPEGSNDGPWTITKDSLTEMLVLKLVEGENGQYYDLGLKREPLVEWMTTWAPGLSRDPENARFIFNDETLQLDISKSATIGRSVDAEMTIQRIEKALREGKHSTGIDFEYINPPVTDDMTGEDLGIVELIHAETSYFYGSSSSRIQNIQTSAAEFHGLLIPPNTTFSMAAAMRDVTLDNGYAEAWIIYGDQTIKGVGGGVCQVSTTFFRAAFFAGYPIVERHPHAYRVSYYEQVYGGGIDPNLTGLDATVYLPLVDFKFTNDSDSWLLVETYVSTSAITFKFYGTKENRSIDWSTTGLTDIVKEPEAIYRYNPDLAEGQIKQIDWGKDGGQVTVFRTVYKDGVYYFDDTFYTNFQEWRDIYEYGPNAELPEDAIIEGEEGNN